MKKIVVKTIETLIVSLYLSIQVNLSIFQYICKIVKKKWYYNCFKGESPTLNY